MVKAILASALSLVSFSAYAAKPAPAPEIGDGFVGIAVIAAFAVGYVVLRSRFAKRSA